MAPATTRPGSRAAAPGAQGPGHVSARIVSSLALRLSRRVGGQMPGDHRAPGLGSGVELAQLRPYQAGDDPRKIDPGASARTGELHVREHIPERALTSWLVVDVSPSMAFGTAQRLKSDVAEGAAMVMAQLAIRGGGRVGLTLAGAPSAEIVAPRGGRMATLAVRRALEAGVAADGSAGTGLGESIARLARLADRPGLLVVISDFRAAEGWERAIKRAGGRHATFAIEIVDPREAELPDVGRLALVDPETGRRVEADTGDARLRRRYAEAEAARRAAVATGLRRAGATHVVLSTGEDWLRELGRRMP